MRLKGKDTNPRRLIIQSGDGAFLALRGTKAKILNHVHEGTNRASCLRAPSCPLWWMILCASASRKTEAQYLPNKVRESENLLSIKLSAAGTTVITLVSEPSPKIVIPVTKFRDEGHLPCGKLERRCPWNVTAAGVVQVFIRNRGKGEVGRFRWAQLIFMNRK
jgi:hypothetical protein